ncbi:hypothetical protein HDU91_004244 [Kappamyces sp. JEL0680]|nr:hypothetical protein HDU91_004244 [Kappamyces sp. JEL0680]
MSSALINMALVFGIVKLANQYQLDAPENATILKITYTSVQAITLAIIGYIYWSVGKKNDKTKLVYSEAKSPFAAEEPPIIQTTNCEYDLQQARALAGQTLMGAVILFFMNYQWGYLRPFLLQSILGFKTLASAPIVQVWVLGYKPEGQLARPWRAPNPFGGAAEPATEKDVKKEAKKEEKKKISSKKQD